MYCIIISLVYAFSVCNNSNNNNNNVCADLRAQNDAADRRRKWIPHRNGRACVATSGRDASLARVLLDGHATRVADDAAAPDELTAAALAASYHARVVAASAAQELAPVGSLRPPPAGATLRAEHAESVVAPTVVRRLARVH